MAPGWYEAIPEKLKKIMDTYFSKVDDTAALGRNERLLGLIAPHAGMSYSGPTASYAYKVLREYLYGTGGKGERVKQIFLLGPSHVKGFEGVEVSAAGAFETPFGPLTVDTGIIAKVKAALEQAGVPVSYAAKATDEREHSIEMQIPFVSHVLYFPPAGQSPKAAAVKIVPMVVGWSDAAMEERISVALQPYLEDEASVFIYSSDFCHWGSRFAYTYHYEPKTFPVIGDAIIAMDRKAIDLLENLDKKAWYAYFKATENTICGRHPISVGLQYWSREDNRSDTQVTFLHYSQSNRCESVRDSSVSYASAIITKG
ncbi:protein MEMO1 [Strigomonas culicis]|uniref:Protein MEMO1 n=1 Tax=Strigomonas culicis TaxID=28005 RepID=S9V050_9TRYP|nr:protein MEMO1 [Strigomonas culicis]|eukprot:EPY34399.1 protein MEMO1 [Strigomonas culicis]